MKRLNTSYIHVLQIHRFDSTVPPEETMRALDDLVRAGMIRHIGASSMWAYHFATLQYVAKKHGWTIFISMQNHYNLLYREEERETNPFCNETGVGLMPVISYPTLLNVGPKTNRQQWAALASGRLARDPGGNEISKRAGMGARGSM